MNLENKNIEKIVNYISDNREKIINYSLIGFIVIVLSLVGVFSYKAYNNFQIVTKKTEKSIIVTDSKIKKITTKDGLRSIYSVTNTINYVYKKDYSIDNVAKLIVLKMLEKGQDSKYYNDIMQIVLSNINDNNLENKINEIISNIKDDEKLLEILGTKKYVYIIKNNFNSLINSDTLTSYLSSFPKVKFREKEIGDVLSKLYVYELNFIEKSLELKKENFEKKLVKYQAPYKYFLVNIFFPSINVWQDPFSGKINPDLFGADYLKDAKYIDINLMNYWGDFFKTPYAAYNGRENEIKDISLGKMSLIKKNGISDIASLPIKVSFLIKDDKSFYGIISKLTSTSNVENVMLISEFTYNIWDNIKKLLNNRINSLSEEIQDKIKDKPIGTRYMISLLYSCENELKDPNKVNILNCSRLFNLPIKAKDLENLNYEDSLTGAYNDIMNNIVKDNKKFKKYFDMSYFSKFIKNEHYKINDIDKLIGARLTNCVKGGYCNDIFTDKKSGDIIERSIEDFAKCEKGTISSCTVSNGYKSEECNKCRFKFINKFSTNYFIAYSFMDNMSNIRKNTFTKRFVNVYSNIMGLLKLGQFNFKKNIDEKYMYNASLSIDVYYKYISDKNISDILSYIGKTDCKKVTKGKSWNLNIAYKFVSDKVNKLYKLDLGADETYNLKKLESLVKKLKDDSKKATNLEKLIANLQVYRIFLERGYCSK